MARCWFRQGHRWIVACLLVAEGCGGPSAYQRVFNGPDQRVNGKTYSADMEACWTAVQRAVLVLNFALDKQDKANGTLEASRYFKEGRRTTRITLQVNVQPDGRHQSLVYATAIQTAEQVFVRSHRRFFLWVIPLPGGGGSEANRVTEAEWTVRDRKFYDTFFQTVERELQTLSAA